VPRGRLVSAGQVPARPPVDGGSASAAGRLMISRSALGAPALTSTAVAGAGNTALATRLYPLSRDAEQAALTWYQNDSEHWPMDLVDQLRAAVRSHGIPVPASGPVDRAFVQAIARLQRDLQTRQSTPLWPAPTAAQTPVPTPRAAADLRATDLAATDPTRPPGRITVDGRATPSLVTLLLPTGLASPERIAWMAGSVRQGQALPHDVLLTYQQQLTSVFDRANLALADSGAPPMVPAYQWTAARWVPQAAGYHAISFDARTWITKVGACAAYYFDPDLPESVRDLRIGGFVSRVYGQARRAEQHFAAAQYAATLGHPTGRIAADLGIPQSVAELAQARINRRQPLPGTPGWNFLAGCYAELSVGGSSTGAMELDAQLTRGALARAWDGD